MDDILGSTPVPPKRRRSSYWFDGNDINGFNHRAWLKPNGFSDEALKDRPVIGIANTRSELVGCNVHLRQLTESVKRGVLQAGGLPLEFPVLSLSETLMKPNAMLFRQLAAMDVESSIHSHPLDAVVLLGSCDKTTPALLMGAASANVPAILVTGGRAGFHKPNTAKLQRSAHASHQSSTGAKEIEPATSEKSRCKAHEFCTI